MDRDYFWLSEEQFKRLEPYFPTDTRGKPRVDDRRVVSGIVHILMSGCRWKDAPAFYGPRKTLYNRFQRWAAKGVWSTMFHALASTGGPPAEVLIDSSAVKAHRCASGGKGGSKATQSAARAADAPQIHALTDRHCRPIAFLLTGGQVPDCIAADTLLDQMPSTDLVHGDKGYDSNAVRQKSKQKERLQISRRNPTASGRIASRPISTETATLSNGCSEGSRTSVK